MESILEINHQRFYRLNLSIDEHLFILASRNSYDWIENKVSHQITSEKYAQVLGISLPSSGTEPKDAIC